MNEARLEPQDQRGSQEAVESRVSNCDGVSKVGS